MLLDEIKNIKSSRKDLRMFGLTVGGVFIVLGVLLLWFGNGKHLYLLIGGISLLLFGLLLPSILKPFQKIWMAAAITMGWFMTRVVLILLFYLIVTPIGMISRLSGKRFLDLRKDNSRKSYWKNKKSREFVKSDYEKQY